MTGFDPDAVPTFLESEARDDSEAWQRLERRRFRLFFALVATVAVTLTALGVWAIDAGLLSGGWPW